MLELLVLFGLATYGLAFIAADAKIFGCPVKDFLENQDDPGYINNVGILKIRQAVLRSRIGGNWLTELLSCYFCMGVWCGLLIHLGFVILAQENSTIRDSYILLSSSSDGFIVSCIIAASAGAAMCYVIDLIVQSLEQATGQ